MTRSPANEHKLIKLNMLLSVRKNIRIMSYNSKYYLESLKNNLFKKASEKRSAEEELDSSGEDSEKSSDIETNDEVYAGYHFSFFITLFYSSS